MYSAVVSDHFHHPRRVGPLVGGTHLGTAGVVGEGPYVVLWLRVVDSWVESAAYRTYGCPAAIACASVLCELVEGRSVDWVSGVEASALVCALDGLPWGKEHCPDLAIGALRVALGGGPGECSGKG